MPRRYWLPSKIDPAQCRSVQRYPTGHRLPVISATIATIATIADHRAISGHLFTIRPGSTFPIGIVAPTPHDHRWPGQPSTEAQRFGVRQCGSHSHHPPLLTVSPDTGHHPLTHHPVNPRCPAYQHHPVNSLTTTATLDRTPIPQDPVPPARSGTWPKQPSLPPGQRRFAGLVTPPLTRSRAGPALGLHFRNVLRDALCDERGLARRISRVA